MESSPNAKPPIVFWFNAYCVFLTLLYVLVALGSVLMVLFIFMNPEMWGSEDSTVNVITFGITAVFCFPLALVCAAPLFFSPRPWLWMYSLILIAMGLTSCCLWPICIPLLIYWIDKRVQTYYGK